MGVDEYQKLKFIIFGYSLVQELLFYFPFFFFALQVLRIFSFLFCVLKIESIDQLPAFLGNSCWSFQIPKCYLLTCYHNIQD